MMPVIDDNYMEQFYKRIVNGKKGNLFTRMDALEDLLKNLQVRDVTQYITSIVNENKEIIIPSLLGGVTDPTDATFSGIVISPSGQTIGGVVYSFAIVVDGVVVSGLGDDGTTVIIGGTGDVVGPSSSVIGNISIFDDTTGKLIADSGYSIDDLQLKVVISPTEPVTMTSYLLWVDTS